MPIKSKKQWSYLKINEPEVFDKFQKEAPVKYADLPEGLEEKNSDKLSYWGLVDYYGVRKEAESIYDKWVSWHNNNNEGSIDSLLRNENYTLVSQLTFYMDQILGISNRATPASTVEEFERALNSIITIYRGGSGSFNKNFKLKRNWISATASRDRVNTFSVYDGTRASRSFSLNKNEHYWVVKINLPLKEILLYQDVGDEEVIVGADWLARSTLLVQEGLEEVVSINNFKGVDTLGRLIKISQAENGTYNASITDPEDKYPSSATTANTRTDIDQWLWSHGVTKINWLKEGKMSFDAVRNMHEAKKKTDVKVKVPVEKQDVIGLIDRKNISDLLNDEQLHKYFAIPENFDRFVKDVNNFFVQKELAPTVNALNEYLTNLNYGPKTIERSIDILSLTDEERAAKNAKEKEEELQKAGMVKQEGSFNKNFVAGEVAPAKKKKEESVNLHETEFKFGDRVKVANIKSRFNQKKGSFIKYDGEDALIDLDSGELLSMNSRFLILETMGKVSPKVMPKAIVRPITPTIKTDIGKKQSDQDNLPREDYYEPSRNNTEGVYGMSEERIKELQELRKKLENTFIPEQVLKLFDEFEKKYLKKEE